MPTTVGIDLAAQAKKTAIAAIDWSAGSAVVTELLVGADDETVKEWMSHPDDAVGIDCPFGWPMPFVDLVRQHTAGTVQPQDTRDSRWRDRFTYRATDRHIRVLHGLNPLSVSADKIGHVAIRLAALMAEFDGARYRDRSGAGPWAEVYPPGALKKWELTSNGYKGNINREKRNALIDDLLATAPYLDPGEYEAMMRESDDAFDAVICALVARAWKLGLTDPPPTSSPERELAEQEGWIHIPTAPLGDLP